MNNMNIDELKKQLLKELKPILLKIKKREYSRKYRTENAQKNRDKMKAYMKKRYDENVEYKNKHLENCRNRYNSFFLPDI